MKYALTSVGKFNIGLCTNPFGSRVSPTKLWHHHPRTINVVVEEEHDDDVTGQTIHPILGIDTIGRRNPTCGAIPSRTSRPTVRSRLSRYTGTTIAYAQSVHGRAGR